MTEEMQKKQKKTAIVTGASSGFGYECCRILLEKGFDVYGISRRGTVPEGAKGISCDISDPEAASLAVKTVLEKTGRVDVLINNAGFAVSGPVEFTDCEAVEKIMKVNFGGAVWMARAVLPAMRAQKNGHIAFVSSVAGEIALPYQAFYSASKSAMSAVALALRNEVHDFGIKVTTIEPGDACTGITAAREKQESGDDVYLRSRSAADNQDKDEQNGMSAAAVAGIIVKAALAKDPGPVYVPGMKYQLLTVLFRIFPRRFGYWIVGKMYR